VVEKHEPLLPQLITVAAEMGQQHTVFNFSLTMIHRDPFVSAVVPPELAEAALWYSRIHRLTWGELFSQFVLHWLRTGLTASDYVEIEPRRGSLEWSSIYRPKHALIRVEPGYAAPRIAIDIESGFPSVQEF